MYLSLVLSWIFFDVIHLCWGNDCVRCNANESNTYNCWLQQLTASSTSEAIGLFFSLGIQVQSAKEANHSYCTHPWPKPRLWYRAEVLLWIPNTKTMPSTTTETIKNKSSIAKHIATFSELHEVWFLPQHQEPRPHICYTHWLTTPSSIFWQCLVHAKQELI